ASPSQVMRQVFSGHTMKGNHPALQPTVVGVHVLDVEGSIDPALPARIDRSVSDAFCLVKARVDGGTIRAKNRINIDQGTKPFPDMHGIELLQLKVGMLPTAISHHQDRNLLGG